MRNMKAVLVAVTLMALPRLGSAKTKVYAMAIGQNNVPKSQTTERLSKLRYADDDAIRYFELFKRLGAETTLFTFLDTKTQRRFPQHAHRAQAPTLKNLKRTVARYQKMMETDRKNGHDAVFYFAFSGHGAHGPDGEPFLALHQGRLTQKRLYQEILAPLPTAYTHVFVDACSAGSILGIRGPSFDNEIEGTRVNTNPRQLSTMLTPLLKHPNIGVLVAAAGHEKAHEWSEIEAGVFTFEVVSGLLGGADVNHDRVVAYTELQAFVASANRSLEDPRAAPTIVARAPSSNHNAPLVALDDLSDSQFLVGDASNIGRFYIELENGLRYLGSNLSETQTAALALPSEGIAYLRTDAKEAVLAPGGRAINFRDLDFSPRQSRGKGSLTASYQRGLFSSPYGRTYYKGYVDSAGLVGVPFVRDDAVGLHAQTTSKALKPLAVGLGVTAVTTAVTSVTTAILAIHANQEFKNTEFQREAKESSDRVRTFTTVAIVSGAVAIASGIASWLLWPEETTPKLVTTFHGNSGSAAAAFRW